VFHGWKQDMFPFKSYDMDQEDAEMYVAYCAVTGSYVCSLLNDAFSNSDFLTLNDWMIVNNDPKDVEGSGRGLM
jgi:hypothetical protein